MRCYAVLKPDLLRWKIIRRIVCTAVRGRVAVAVKGDSRRHGQTPCLLALVFFSLPGNYNSFVLQLKSRCSGFRYILPLSYCKV